MIKLPQIDWGKVVNKGFEILQEKVGQKSGPVGVIQQPNDFTPVESKMPGWLVPLLIVGGAWLFLKKKKRR